MNDIMIAFKNFKYKKSKGKIFIDNIVIKKCLNGEKIIYNSLNDRTVMYILGLKFSFRNDLSYKTFEKIEYLWNIRFIFSNS